MHQRTWSVPGAERARTPPEKHARPWLLVEDPSPVAQVSDFSLFHQAGFEVAVCSGPDRSGTCPLTEGRPCELADAADVVLFGLDVEEEPGRSVLQAHLRRNPDRPVVVELPRGRGAKLPDGATECAVLGVPASVEGQTRTLWQALYATGWGRPHHEDPAT